MGETRGEIYMESGSDYPAHLPLLSYSGLVTDTLGTCTQQAVMQEVSARAIELPPISRSYQDLIAVSG